MTLKDVALVSLLLTFNNTSEAHLEVFQTFMMRLFCEAVNYFRKKASS